VPQPGPTALEFERLKTAHAKLQDEAQAEAAKFEKHRALSARAVADVKSLREALADKSAQLVAEEAKWAEVVAAAEATRVAEVNKAAADTAEQDAAKQVCQLAQLLLA
jgi:hypothetical protein